MGEGHVPSGTDNVCSSRSLELDTLYLSASALLSRYSSENMDQALQVFVSQGSLKGLLPLELSYRHLRAAGSANLRAIGRQ